MKREEGNPHFFSPFSFFFFRNKLSCSTEGRTNCLVSVPGKWQQQRDAKSHSGSHMFPTQTHSLPADSSLSLWAPTPQHEARLTGSADLWDLEPLCGPKEGRKPHPSAPPGLHQPFAGVQGCPKCQAQCKNILVGRSCLCTTSQVYI